MAAASPPKQSAGQPGDKTLTFQLRDIHSQMLDSAAISYLKERVLNFDRSRMPQEFQKATSILLTWTLSSYAGDFEELSQKMRDITGDKGPQHPGQLLSGMQAISCRGTLQDGSVLREIGTFKAREDGFVAVRDSVFLVILRQLYEVTQAILNSSQETSNIENQYLRLPFQFRVRDIVLYRYLKDFCKKNDLPQIKLLCDNVADAKRAEATKEPLITFCAECSKFATTHSRCSGCKVNVVDSHQKSLILFTQGILLTF